MATELTNLLSGFGIKCKDEREETSGMVLSIEVHKKKYILRVLYRRDDNGKIASVGLYTHQLGFLVANGYVYTKTHTIQLSRTYPLTQL